MLPGAYALLSGNDNARDEAEADLRDDKPRPVNPLAKHRIEETPQRYGSEPDHRTGAMKPPNRIGRRGNIGSMAP